MRAAEVPAAEVSLKKLLRGEAATFMDTVYDEEHKNVTNFTLSAPEALKVWAEMYNRWENYGHDVPTTNTEMTTSVMYTFLFLSFILFVVFIEYFCVRPETKQRSTQFR